MRCDETNLRHGLSQTPLRGLRRIIKYLIGALYVWVWDIANFIKPYTTMRKVLLSICCALFVSAVAMAQGATSSERYVSINASVNKMIPPDVFYLQITLNESDSKGRVTVESQQREIIDALTTAGIDCNEQLKTLSLTSEYFKRNTTFDSLSFELTLNSAEQVATVWQALNNLGISEIRLDRVDCSDMSQIRDRLRAEAMQEARRRAELLAESVGQRIGECIYIEEETNPRAIFNSRAVVYQSIELDAEESLPQFQDIELRFSIVAHFKLLDKNGCQID